MYCDCNYPLDSRPQKEIKTLIEHGFDVFCVAWGRTKTAPIEIKKPLDAHRNYVGAFIYEESVYGGGFLKNIFPLLKFQIRLYLFLKKARDQYDVIHACNFQTAYVAEKIAHRYGKKLVYDIFDYYVDSHIFRGPLKLLRGIVESMDICVINSADAVIICSEKRRAQIRKASPKLIEIIHNTPPKVEINCFRDQIQLDTQGLIRVGYVGLLNAERPIVKLAELISEIEGIELHCAGYGPDAQTIAALSVNFPNIFFYGQLSYEQTLSLESKCDILPALYDPEISNHYYAAPNKFCEALMLGKPLIMIRNTGMDEYVSMYDIGEIAQSANKQDIKVALLKLIDRKEKWATMSVTMQRLYDREFSWTEMERRLFDVYDRIK